MSDTFITSGDTTPGSAVTEPEELQTASGGSGAETSPETTGESDAGGGKPSTEDGRPEQDTKRRHTVYDDLRELRAFRREARDRESTWTQERQQILEELRALRESQNRPGPGTAAQPRKNFWQDPEGVLEERLTEKLSHLEESIANRFTSVREQETAQAALHQERTGAVEFIRAQKGYDPADDEDLAEIIHSIPGKENLSPQFVAEYAWLKFQQTRGVGDRSVARQRAASVVGQPPGAGLGKKQYSTAEYDQAVNQAEEMFRRNPNDPKLNDFLSELHNAQRDGRVK